MARQLSAAVATALFVVACGADDAPNQLKVKAGGLKREALVFAPESTPKNGSPVVFVFHGHGGTPKDAVREFEIHKHWPEALCVYMEGIPTPRPSDPKGQKTGWQTDLGEQNDRDLKFFDEALAKVRKDYKVNDDKVFVAGFSNGGGMAFLLWEQRGDALAGVASFSAAAGDKLKNLKAKPCLLGSGVKEDGHEKLKKSSENVRKLNGCDADGDAWPPKGKSGATLFPSKGGTPVVWYPHAGDHEVPKDAGTLVVRFFKMTSKER